MPPRRERTVEGSCWPCKRRRVKCDLLTPTCGRCLASGATCSYGKLRVRWSSWPTRGLPVTTKLPGTGLFDPDLLDKPSLPTNERRALDYFRKALWPLFTTVGHPCPPPISLALQSQPVLLAICELAQAHHALSKPWVEQESVTALPPSKRLDCLASIRQQLRHSGNNPEALSRVLVAVLLIYFLDGYIDCSEQSASTGCHEAGVQAIVESLGGFGVLVDKCQEETSMLLLSEFASSNLTRSLLDNRLPCFPADIWKHIESGTVWWEKRLYGETSLSSVFFSMAEMAFYRHSVQANRVELSMDEVRRFEAALQPTFVPLNIDHLGNSAAHLLQGTNASRAMHSIAFTRAFQHSATIYLYRAVCGLHPRHYLVQQHVYSCIECINGIDRSSKAHNCIIFPLYVVGAHAFSRAHQRFVLGELEAVHQTLRFSSVLLIQAALEDLWGSEAHEGDWSGMFNELAQGILVL